MSKNTPLKPWRVFMIMAGLSLAMTIIGAVSARAEGAVTAVMGAVSILRDGKNIAPTFGQVVKSGDVVETEQGASLDLSMNDVSGMRLEGSGSAVLTETSPGSTKIALHRGSAVFNIDKLSKKSSFEVETPTAIASVRGTQFSCRVHEAGSGSFDTNFAVRDGSLEVFMPATNETLTLNKGQALDVPHQFNHPIHPRAALGAELSALDKASTVRTCS